ncbi:ArsR/SmtB family transcription factor [Brevifollis gellanilyticus]|uniref:ArsR/SmtB family transcription factor n=1 Tax=Brevifollis gellanilyticus TaxID=748831 RepID=UPI001FE6E08B|nr:helix-turn-helix domain-containing protein [Brevifollis gellanilyticus]
MKFVYDAFIRPLHHPPADSITLPGVLHALSDPVRLSIVAELRKAEDGLNCVETTSRLKCAMPKSTCSQHYRILRESGIIHSERRGTELTSRVRRKELDARYPGLLDTILKAWKREQE